MKRMVSQEGELIAMQMIPPEPDPNSSQQNAFSNRSKPTNLKEGLKSLGANWTLAIFQDISKPLQIIVSEFIIFIVFILLDIPIVALIGWAAADIISQYVFFAWLYAGIKFSSFIVIALRYFCNCFFEILKLTVRVNLAAFPTF